MKKHYITLLAICIASALQARITMPAYPTDNMGLHQKNEVRFFGDSPQPKQVTNPQTRWKIVADNAIEWQIGTDIPHSDHIEMSGEQVSVVLRYGVKADGSLGLERSMIWPMLRTIPNDTHASLKQRFAIDYPTLLVVNGLSLAYEKVKSIRLDGRMTVVSQYCLRYNHIGVEQERELKPTVEIKRIFFPSTDKPMLCEQYIIRNISDNSIAIQVPSHRSVYCTDPLIGVDGAYTVVNKIHQDEQSFIVAPGESISFEASLQAYKNTEKEQTVDVPAEMQARNAFVQEIHSKLQFHSPDSVLNTAFAFAKIRASESIFKTKGGYMHSPGGEAYYAAVWANDQAEYVNPFFPFLGYEKGNQSAFNSFMHFARFINADYNPIPSSVIAEGLSSWSAAGDRGDCAMIAYGAGRYALTHANREEARELWPLIEWCLEFCKRKLTPEGVVASDSDELERRFPAGKANLCTSSLYYDALLSASYLAKELGIPATNYKKEAEELKKAINNYFSATVEGFETYRYYEGNDVLRSWICIPLTVGIYERSAGTIDALFSPRLWTKDGLLTQAGSETFWDRSTLYALRGVYAAGETEKATAFLTYYSTQRLLGEHVPYPIEAWPEGNQRHLSAENGLYCRIISEGLFGLRPTGFNSFLLTPQLPDGWDKMSLTNIYAFGGVPFDVIVVRKGKELQTNIVRSGKTIKTFSSATGKTLTVRL